VSFAEILPMAFVMVAGPQLVSAVFFATSERLGQELVGLHRRRRNRRY
jgi:hypothetical protein